MVRAWYMDDDPNDPKSEHHQNPSHFITVEELYKICHVEYFKFNLNTVDTDGKLDDLKNDRGYTHEDVLVCSKECLPDYEEKLKCFYTEHLHTEEEIRLVLEGSGYFDVRDRNDDWIRIEVVPGDLLALPSGIYHRFTLDNKINFIRLRRLFIGKPTWTSHNRPCSGNMECRQNYVRSLGEGNIVNV